MHIGTPEHNSFGFYRTHFIDAEGRRISVKERGVHRNQMRLDIISQLQTVTLTQEDAAKMVQLLAHYAINGTIADYVDDDEQPHFELALGAVEACFPAQPERVVWVHHPAIKSDEMYTAHLPSGAVLRVQWEEEDGVGGWVGRFGGMYTNPKHAALDAKDQIMAHYLDSIEQDVEQLKASLP